MKNHLESRIEEEQIGHEEDLCLCCMLDPKFKNFDFKRDTGEMRDNAKKYLMVTYVADWAPKHVLVPSSSTSNLSTVRAQRPPKANRCFLDDTDDEDDEEYEEQGEFAIYFVPLYETSFYYVSSSCVRAQQILL